MEMEQSRRTPFALSRSGAPTGEGAPMDRICFPLTVPHVAPGDKLRRVEYFDNNTEAVSAIRGYATSRRCRAPKVACRVFGQKAPPGARYWVHRGGALRPTSTIMCAAHSYRFGSTVVRPRRVAGREILVT